jgi:glycosyltransferase involved in cell wall biosynthesis
VRIAYVITRADAVGGASIHVRDLARAMIERGHEAVVLVGGAGPVTDQLAAAGVPFRSLRFLARPVHPLRDARAFLELVSELSRTGPDLVSTHTAKAGWIGRAAAARLGLPALFTPHGWAFGGRMGRGGMPFALAERAAARWTAGIVCVCEYERELALKERIAGPDRLFVVYNGVSDVPESLRARPGEPGTVRIVSVARLERPKDHPTLLRALAALAAADWELELVGDGPLEPAARVLCSDLGIAGRVRFRGYDADPSAALARAQVFVLSSRSEGFPRSVLEAMRAGLPVIASDVGGVREAVCEGITGRLVPTGDVEALSTALAALISSPQERQRLGAAARHTYENRFRLDRVVGETILLYDKIIQRAQLAGSVSR